MDDAGLERIGEAAGRNGGLLEQRARLGICALLASGGSLSFTRLKELLELTDGNLSVHLRKLEDAGYLEARKQFVERKPVSWYKLTALGHKELRKHFDGLEELIKSVR